MWKLLLRNRLQMGRNRLTQAPPGARRGLSLVVALAGMALLVAGMDIAQGVATDEDPVAAVRQIVFWLNVLHALVFSYTTFEVLFRSSEVRVLAPLPVRMSGYFVYTWLRTLWLHALLLVPSLLLTLPLVAEGHATLFAYAALSFLLTFAAGVPLSVLLHLLAGRSLLSGSTRLKQQLIGGIAPTESAFLFYSPALALAGTLTSAVALDLVLRVWLEVGNPKPLLFATAAVAAVAGACTRASSRIFRDAYERMLPRFWETEILPPYHEEHLPRRIVGLSLARRLRGPAAEIFSKDLIQMRRRHRVDGVVYAAFFALALLVNLRAEHADMLWAWNVLLIGLATGAVFNPAARLLGPDLESAWVLRSQPIPRRAFFIGKMTVALLQQAPAAALGAIAAAVGPGGPLAALAALLVGSAVGLTAAAVSLVVGLRSFPTIRPLAWGLRLGLFGAAALCVSFLPPL